MRDKELLIFDFDGTLANTLAIALDILNDLGSDYHLPEVDHSMATELKHKSVRELLGMAKISWLQLPGFLRKARTRFRHRIASVHPITGIPEMVEELARENRRMGILTSNREDNVREFLRTHRMEHFEFVESSNNIFGKSRKLRRIMRRTGLGSKQLVMIGDELRDVEAARKVGVTSIGVTWGFNSARLLSEGNPDHVVSRLEELRQLLDLPPAAIS